MSRLIAVLAAGSRGDIQPCVALGKGLAARGDKVRIIASRRYERLTTEAGLEFVPLTVDPTELLGSPEGQEWLSGGRDPVRFVRNFGRLIRPMAERLLAEALAGCRGADLMLAPTLGFFGVHVAEYLGIPHALVHFQPSQPTRAFPHPLLPHGRMLGPFGNALSFHAVDQVAWQLLRPFLNPWRSRELGLARLPVRGPMRAVRRDAVPVLCCFSEAVVRRPADWPSNVHVTGYWFLDEAPGWTPSAELSAFLNAGPPPVYVGFGSMVPKDPARTYETLRAALDRTGLRAIISTALLPVGHPATDPPPGPATSDPGGDLRDGDVLFVSDVPHAWLFPRVAAVVHHGGAGTTAAGLRAGVPTVVCPFFGDQPYWGERVAALGAGPAPLPIRSLTPDALAAGLELATGDNGPSRAVRSRARAIAAHIAEDNGVERACSVLAHL